jgi:hypothetical protein
MLPRIPLHGHPLQPYHRIMFILAQNTADIPVPLSTDWAPSLLLTILWIFVAAAVAGVIFRFFNLDRDFREGQS